MESMYNANELIEAMSDDELLVILEKNKGKESVEKLVNGILEARETTRKEQAELETFMQALEALELPIPPISVHNIYNPYRKATRKLNKKEREELKQTQPDITEEQLDSKQVETDKFVWGGWQVNKAMNVTSSNQPKATTTSTKRAITVKKIDGDSLVLVGHFRNGNEACQYLKLQTGGDSAIRVLGRFGYVNEAYTGTDFTIKQT